jgi:hypothetical protein
MEKKPCVRCGRLVDPVARLCPYCNWDQELAAPPADAAVPAFVDDRPDPATQQRRRVLRRALVAAGVAVLLVGTFVVGGLVLRIGKSAADRKPTEDLPGQEAARGASGRAVTDLTLVSVDPTSTVGRSITSAPPASPSGEVIGTDRPDITALALQQYSEVARRAAAETPLGETAPTLDPRTIRPEPLPPPRVPPPAPTSTARLPEPPGTLSSTERPTPVEREPPMTAPPPPERERSESRRTRPRAISQPLPDLDINGTARFRLRIGADGSVREVEVLQTIAGSTAQLVSAIQGWRFEPATENGRPVEGTHIVDVSFHARNGD